MVLNYSGLQPGSREGMDMATRIVDKCFQLDSSYPQMIDMFTYMGDLLSVTGLSDADYPVLTKMSGSLRSLTQTSPVKKVPLPAELLEQFGHMQSNCQMGLFPEIARAWLTIDSDIFLWTYEDGGDLAYFDGLNETILTVGLVKPKPGIFQAHIQFLLCLATPLEIILLGVNFSRQKDDSSVFEEMHLLPEPLFSVPTDNTFMTIVKGTEQGRIFMGGKDGSLYEITYQAEDGWFRRRCTKLNHSCRLLSFLVPSFLIALYEEDPLVQIEIDESRQTLYTRSEKGTVQVFDMGSDGKSLSKVTSLSQNAIVMQAAQAASTVERSNFKPVVHISTIELAESVHLNLVATTQSGVRLYFTTTSIRSPAIRPCSLALVHVRLPPGFSASAPLQRPSHVHMAYYRRGTLVLASSETDDRDIIWVMSNDSFPFENMLMEIHTTLPINGRTWAMKEVVVPSPHRLYCSMVLGDTVVPSEPPLVVLQHAEKPRKFVFLSAQGSHIIMHLRPVDQLRQLLTANQGPDCEAVKAFFMLLKETQACATALILSCSPVPQDQQVAEWAARAFFLYGGEPYIHTTSNPLQIQPANPMPSSPVAPAWSPSYRSPLPGVPITSTPLSGYTPTSTPMHVHSSDQYQSNLVPGQSTSMPTQSTSDVIFSGKHDGLYFYFSRILRPFWNMRVVSDAPFHPEQGQPELLVSNATSEQLGNCLHLLNGLKMFMAQHGHACTNIQPSTHTISPQLSGYVRVEDVTQMQQELQKKAQAEVQIQEKMSLCNLQYLISHASEVLGLWKVLCDHQFHVLIASLTKDLQSQLKAMSCRDFIVSGSELTSALVVSLINHYIDDNATTDAICSRLREVCPSIFRTEDAMFSKAHEKLVKVKNIRNKQEKELILKEALQLCKQISPNLQLPAICSLFQNVQYYEGIIDLCLAAAQRRDTQGLAMHFYKNGEPQNDTQGLQAYASRMECYKCVMDTLAHLKALSVSHPQAPSVPKVPGPPPAPEPDTLSPEEAKSYMEQILHMGIQSEDELFHMALYTWLIEQQHVDTLLEIKSPYLESYLKRATVRHPESKMSMDLMWKYYEKNKNFAAAARILSKLSERHSVEINLEERLEYMSRAIICVKSSEIRMSSTSEGEFLHELEEKMEVARIQLQILEAIQQRFQTVSVSEAVDNLNADLLDVTQLYEDYAEHFDLPESKLAIIHCAGHYDPTLVETLWQRIINKELQETPSFSGSATIGSKLKALGRLYVSSQKYFPLPFLIKYLELRTCTMNFETEWVYRTIMAIGVPFPQILDIYHKLYRSKDQCWRNVQQPFHLLHVFSHMTAEFAANPSLVPTTERRAVASKCLDIISGYLVDLQADGASDTRNLVATFRSTQAKLERIL